MGQQINKTLHSLRSNSFFSSSSFIIAKQENSLLLFYTSFLITHKEKNLLFLFYNMSEDNVVVIDAG